MEAKLHHSDSLDILCRKVNLMALDTAMKIEEILKISLYVTSRDSKSETPDSSTPTRHLKFLDDQSMDKRTVHRILSEISEVFGYSVNATKLIPIEPRFPKNYNVVGGTTPKVLYNCDCFFVISPTRTALPGFSNASMTSNSSSNSCIV